MSKRTLHAFLTPDAAGHLRLDPSDPTGGAHGGGSRAGFLGLVRAMGRLNRYDITAFSAFTQKDVTLDGVRYVRIDNSRSFDQPDICCAYYDCMPLYGKTARLRIGMHHTYVPLNPSWPWPHVQTAPSEHAMRHLRDAYRPRDRWAVLPNAVEGLEGIEWNPVPGRVIYQTSPDRGLHLLLEAWPAIKERVPHATLHIGGDPNDTMRDGSWGWMHHTYEQGRTMRMQRGLELAQAAGGVTLYGRVSRAEVLRELSEADCMAYPTELSVPSETFSISILECCTIGVPVVLAPSDALGEVYAGSGVLFTRSPADRYLNEFADAVCRVLTVPGLAADISRRQKAFAARFSFDKTAAILSDIIERNYIPEAP